MIKIWWILYKDDNIMKIICWLLFDYVIILIVMIINYHYIWCMWSLFDGDNDKIAITYYGDYYVSVSHSMIINVPAKWW